MKHRPKKQGQRGDLRTTGVLMETLTAKYRIAPEVQEDTLMQAWDSLVGPRVAKRARPASLRRGLLTIIVSSSAWMQELHFMKDDLLQRLEELGNPNISVREIRYVLAGTRPAHAAVPTTGVVRGRARRSVQRFDPATGKDLDRIFKETLDVEDDELRELIYRTRAKHNR